MSGNELPSAEELDEQIVLAAGRRTPFTMIGDWIWLADATPTAKALYGILAMHVNLNRGDQRAWPSLATLAKLLKLGKPTSVVRYLQELKALGAIDIIKERYANGMRCRNIYVVHETAPDGYAGSTSLEDYYLVEKGTPGSPLQGTTARPAETRKSPGQPVVPSRGGPDVPSRGGRGVPPRGLEQDEVKQDEVKPTTTTGAAENPAGPGAKVIVDAEIVSEDPPVGAPGELFKPPADEEQKPPAKRGRPRKITDPAEQALHDLAYDIVDKYIAWRRLEKMPEILELGKNGRSWNILMSEVKGALRRGDNRDRIATALGNIAKNGNSVPSAGQWDRELNRLAGAVRPAAGSRRSNNPGGDTTEGQQEWMRRSVERMRRGANVTYPIAIGGQQ